MRRIKEGGYLSRGRVQDALTLAVAETGVPTLVVAAEDDTLAPYKDSRAMADRIPGARFVSVRRGGHALTQLDAGARIPVAEFLDAARRPVADRSPVLSQGG